MLVMKALMSVAHLGVISVTKATCNLTGKILNMKLLHCRIKGEDVNVTVDALMLFKPALKKRSS